MISHLQADDADADRVIRSKAPDKESMRNFNGDCFLWLPTGITSPRGAQNTYSSTTMEQIANADEGYVIRLKAPEKVNPVSTNKSVKVKVQKLVVSRSNTKY